MVNNYKTIIVISRLGLVIGLSSITIALNFLDIDKG